MTDTESLQLLMNALWDLGYVIVQPGRSDDWLFRARKTYPGVGSQPAVTFWWDLWHKGMKFYREEEREDTQGEPLDWRSEDIWSDIELAGRRRSISWRLCELAHNDMIDTALPIWDDLCDIAATMIWNNERYLPQEMRGRLRKSTLDIYRAYKDLDEAIKGTMPC